jgi:hypothetical protein
LEDSNDVLAGLREVGLLCHFGTMAATPYFISISRGTYEISQMYTFFPYGTKRKHILFEALGEHMILEFDVFHKLGCTSACTTY